MTLYLLWTKLKTLIRAQADINENNVNKISNLQIVSLSKNFFGQKTFFGRWHLNRPEVRSDPEKVSLVSVQVFNVRRLDGLQVPEVRLDDHDAVDVEAHPEAFAQGREDHLEVDVVAEHQPEAEHGLEEDDDVHEVDPGQQKSSDA